MNPDLQCPVCGDCCELFDVVDFNKSCEELRGKFLRLAGSPVYYALCGACGFCFAPEFRNWNRQDFSEKIYNDGYLLVDPDYLDARPRANANSLLSNLGDQGRLVRHLDYGGGSGLLSKILNDSGWQSTSYDSFDNQNTDIHELGKFGLITAYEVFEHAQNIQSLMADVRALLAQDGIVLFSTLLSNGNIVPNKRLNWWYAAPRNGHISLFSRESLTILAQANGLNFASFSEGFHIFYTVLPAWAASIRLK